MGKQQEKKIDRMIDGLVMSKLESEIHRRYRDAQKKLQRERKRTLRQEVKMKQLILLPAPPKGGDVVDAEIVEGK